MGKIEDYEPFTYFKDRHTNTIVRIPTSIAQQLKNSPRRGVSMSWAEQIPFDWLRDPIDRSDDTMIRKTMNFLYFDTHLIEIYEKVDPDTWEVLYGKK